jgi:PAS domain S-box-containing protein
MRMSTRKANQAKKAKAVSPTAATSLPGSECFKQECLSLMFEKMLNCVVYCRMLYEGAQPVDYLYLYANPAFLAFTGLESVAGKCISELAPWFRASAPELFETYGRVARGAPSEYLEIYVSRIDRWLSIHASSPQPEHFIAILTDISERKAAAAALQASEERFRTLINSNNAIILQIDPVNGRILEANESATRFYGWSHDALCAMAIQDINLFDTEKVIAGLKAAAGKNKKPFVSPHRLASGKTRTVEVHSTPIKTGHREILVSIIHDITERERDAAKVDCLIKEQGAILNSDIVGIVKIRERKFVWANAAFAAMIGYTQEELIGLPSRAIYPSDQAHAKFGETANQVMQRNETFRSEIQYRNKEGKVRWFKVTGELLAPGSNESIWAFVDITELKQAEEKLALSEARYARVLEGSAQGFWDWNCQTGAISVSPRFEAMLGYAPGEWECSHENWLRHTHPDDINATMASFNEHMAGIRPSHDGQFRMRTKSGEWVWIQTRGRIVERDAEGKPLMLSGTHTDITDRKMVEDALASSEARLRGIFSAISEGLVIHGQDGKIIEANLAAEKILGLKRPMILGQSSTYPLWQAIHEDGTPFRSFEHPALVTLRTGLPQRAQIMGIRAGAEELRWISINTIPMFSVGVLSPYAVIATFFDITERIKDISRLKTARNNLELLTQEQATHLRELSAELTHAEQRERDRLFALLHDDVQPLLVAARLSLSRGNAQSAPEELLRQCSAANEHITQVLRVARTLSDELSSPLVRERGLIPALTSLCRWFNDTYGLEITLGEQETDTDNVAIRLNCFNAVRELLLNIVKHARATHARIDLQLIEDDQLFISVTDDGVGFDPSAISSGSGLAGISRRMTMLGGTLRIDSRFGQTVIALSVPR